MQQFTQEDDYKKILTRAQAQAHDAGMDDILYLYRTTTEDVVQRIVSETKGEVTLKFTEKKVHYKDIQTAPIATSKQAGVWFCSTLYNGNLPDISPYGTHMVTVPIEEFLHQFKTPDFYVEHIHHYGGENKYIRLILVDSTVEANLSVLEQCKKIDIKNNPFLILDKDNKTYKVAKRPVWVEVFVPRSINFKFTDSTYKVKEVEVSETGKQTTQPTPGYGF